MSRYLLDTHLVYWWMTANPCLGKATQDLIAEFEIMISPRRVHSIPLRQSAQDATA